MNAPKGNIITRRNFLKLTLAGVGTSAVGLYLFCEEGDAVNYSDPAYLYWNKFTQGGLNLENYLILCGSLAPSAHNTQPWKFSIKEKEISVFADHQRSLGSADAQHRMILISVGCALENIKVAANQLGYRADISLAPSAEFEKTGMCAKVTLVSDDQLGGNVLFDSIFKRQTTRSPYLAEPTPEIVKSSIMGLNDFSNVSLRWFDDTADLASMAEINSAACVAFTKDDPAYLDSLKWWRYSREEILKKRDGISIFTSAAPAAIKQYFQYGVSPEDMAGDFGKQGEIDLMKNLFSSTPLWGVITANDVSNASRLQSGQLFERIFLDATRQNYRMQAINYVPEQKEYADKFKDLFGIPKMDELLMVFRVGKADLCEKSVRLPLSDIIV